MNEKYTPQIDPTIDKQKAKEKQQKAQYEELLKDPKRNKEKIQQMKQDLQDIYLLIEDKKYDEPFTKITQKHWEKGLKEIKDKYETIANRFLLGAGGLGTIPVAAALVLNADPGSFLYSLALTGIATSSMGFVGSLGNNIRGEVKQKKYNKRFKELSGLVRKRLMAEKKEITSYGADLLASDAKQPKGEGYYYDTEGNLLPRNTNAEAWDRRF